MSFKNPLIQNFFPWITGHDYIILTDRNDFCIKSIFTENIIKTITGMDVSFGILVIKKDKIAFFSDGRYMVHLSEFLCKQTYDIFDISKVSVNDYLKNHLSKKTCLHINPYQFTIAENLKIEKICQEKKSDLKTFGKSLYQKQKIKKKGFLLDEKFCGKNYQTKIADLIDNIDLKNGNYLICDVPSINWLLNIRGYDCDYIPVLLSRMLVDLSSHNVTLYMDLNNLTQDIKSYLSDIKIMDINDFENDIFGNETFYADYNETPLYIKNIIENNLGEIKNHKNPVPDMKSIKNQAEINGFYDCHIEKSLAFIRFLSWLDLNIDKTDEILAAKKIASEKSKGKHYIGESFPPISGFNSNAAIIHYSANTKTNKKITKNGIYLIDSGAQYLNGTTDATRTIATGDNIDIKIKRHYTAVLKGHLALLVRQFDFGITGGDLDKIARNIVKSHTKMDFPHSVGHGVGHCLSVHESPPRVSKNFTDKIMPNMVMSNEPGLYIKGEYGIRIENMMVSKQTNDNKIFFESLTKIPYDIHLIDFTMLDDIEIEYIKNHHNDIYKTFASKLNDLELSWLSKHML